MREKALPGEAGLRDEFQGLARLELTILAAITSTPQFNAPVLARRRSWLRPEPEFAPYYPGQTDQASSKQPKRAGFRDELCRDSDHTTG